MRGLFTPGITGNLERRVYEHKVKIIDGFTKRYNRNLLVYYEATSDALSGIERESRLKAGVEQKVTLIESVNLNWNDLSDIWYDKPRTELADSSLRSE